MAAKTQLGLSATPGRRYGSFAGRAPSGSSHPVNKITRLSPAAIPGRRAGSFAGRAPSGGGSGAGGGYIFDSFVN